MLPGPRRNESMGRFSKNEQKSISGGLPKELSRREFLHLTAVGVASFGMLGTVAGLTKDALATHGPAAWCSSFGVFDPHTYETVTHIAEQIVPTDPHPGGNTEACGANFIELLASGNGDLAELLINGVSAIDQSSTLLSGSDFVDLSFEQQTEILKKLEGGTAPGSIWNSILFRNFRPSKGQPVSPGLKSVINSLRLPLGPMGMSAPNFIGKNIQQVVFGTYRELAKLAWVINFPEAFVRNPTNGQPIFADPEHLLISDPNTDGTGTCWDSIAYHVFDFETEKLHWEWQAGMKVTGFENGWPVFASRPLQERQRLQARDNLYDLSDQRLA